VLAAIAATSPIGRRSGAHLNPAVTLGFFARGHTHTHDLMGYAIAQTMGAVAAAGLFEWVWGGWADKVNHARTVPIDPTGAWQAAGIEAGLTAALLLVIFSMVSSPRTARWTPAVVTGGYPALWVYFLGPPVGALVAAGAFTLLARERTTLTAKLFHDSDYPTTQRTLLPAKPHRR
jgi:aquaporin Z